MRKRSALQEQMLEMMRAGEIAGNPLDDLADATLLALERRGDVTRTECPGSVLKSRWLLTEQGRGGPRPERSAQAQMIADHLSSTQRDCLAFWPRGYWSHGTVQALRQRKLIQGPDVLPLGKEVRTIIRERAANV